MLNIDGSASANPDIGGLGRVYRGHNSCWVLGFYLHLPHTTPTMAELLALRHGLTIAKSNNLKNFTIQTNSNVILQMLVNDHSSYHNILNECRSLVR